MFMGISFAPPLVDILRTRNSNSEDLSALGIANNETVSPQSETIICLP
jgi:hypothetical protein